MPPTYVGGISFEINIATVLLSAGLGPLYRAAIKYIREKQNAECPLQDFQIP